MNVLQKVQLLWWETGPRQGKMGRRPGNGTPLDLADPFFEGSGVLLADDDLFVHRQYKLYADLASLERFEALYIVRVDDILPVGPVKNAPVKFFFQLAEIAFLRHILAVLLIDQEDKLVLREEVAYVLYSHGLKFHASFNKDPRFLFIVAGQVVGEGGMIVHEMALEVLVFSQRVLELVLADGFFEIVDAIIVEGAGNIFIIGRGKDHGAGDADRFENIEREAVGQLDVHEYEVGLGILVQPSDAFIHAGAAAHDGNGLIYSSQLFHHILVGGLFIFYNKHFHIFSI